MELSPDRKESFLTRAEGPQCAGRRRFGVSRLVRRTGIAAMTIGSLLAVGGHTATAATPHTLAVSTDTLNFGQQTLGVFGTLTLTLRTTAPRVIPSISASATYTGPGAANYFVLGSSGVSWRAWTNDRARGRDRAV